MTIILNFAMAALWYYGGAVAAPVLLPLSVVVFVYSFAHDWHVDAAAYRAALKDVASSR